MNHDHRIPDEGLQTRAFAVDLEVRSTGEGRTSSAGPCPTG